MITTESDLRYDFDSIGNLPRGLFFLEPVTHEVENPQIFTVTRKAIDYKERKVKIFILEFNDYIEFDVNRMHIVLYLYPN